ncbi:MAG TPA: hypothetical protein P5038_13465 [Candidatus Paceibacterota bacterium]|nr:hypothetical protein [Candidatus Paceibacterota bacterium]
METLLKKHSEVQAELERIEFHDREAKALVEKIMADGVVEDKELRQLGDAQLKLQLTEPRKKKCASLLAQLEKEIQVALRVAASAWNRRVKAARVAMEDRIVAVNLPFFDGNEKRARRWLIREGYGPPFDALQRIGRCAWSGAEAVPTPGDNAFWAGRAKLFLEHVKKCEKVFAELGCQ